MEKKPMTRRGHTALETELKHLKSTERPAIIKAIAEAREHGDLSENAEYHSAREKHSFIEGRVKEIEGTLSLAEVIDPTSLSGAIKFGATVRLVDEDTDEEKTWQIVGENEANIEQGLLNMKSPIARALIGKEEGDSVEVKTPGGDRSYEVLSIQYIYRKRTMADPSDTFPRRYRLRDSACRYSEALSGYSRDSSKCNLGCNIACGAVLWDHRH